MTYKINTIEDKRGDIIYPITSTESILDHGQQLQIDNRPRNSSNAIVRSNGVFDEISINGAAYDVSAANGYWPFVDLQSALNAVPPDYQRGGMSIRYIQRSDLKYVTWTCSNTMFSTNVSDWHMVHGGDGVFNISEQTSSTSQPVSYASLLDALGADGANVPIGMRSGGMSIRFLNSTTGKYEEYRCTTSAITDNAEFINEANWEGVDYEPKPGSNNLVRSGGVSDFYGEYTSSPEFVRVIISNNNKVLFGIKWDGEIFFGVGVPEQIVSYVKNKLGNYDKDDYDGIVEFLSGIDWHGEKLTDVLDGKVDKVEGMSLINEDFASAQNSTESVEWLYVVVDNENKVIGGIKKTGEVEWYDGVPAPVREYVRNEVDYRVGDLLDKKVDKVSGQSLIDSGVSQSLMYVDNPEFLNVVVDNKNKLIEVTKLDGTKRITTDVEVDGNVVSKGYDLTAFVEEFTQKNSDFSVLDSIKFIENPEFITTTLDSANKILEYRKNDGVHVECVGVKSPVVSTDKLELSEEGMNDFQNALKASGFNPGAKTDWSDEKYIHLPTQPTCALVNITNIDEMPTRKGVNMRAYMEVWDKNGNYFRKKVFLNAQGNSSMTMPKKNFAADFFYDDWDGKTTDIKIGNWVTQDSFHFKAYYTSLTKAECPVSYRIYDNFQKTKKFDERAPYMEYYNSDYAPTGDGNGDLEQDMEVSARCWPDGFPCIVYLNGDFYGIFMWQLKKHRKNYHMSKSNPNHIHLDGNLGKDELFGGVIKWKEFEIRNPKSLVYATKHGSSYEYDADVSQDEIAGNSDGSPSYPNWGEVPSYQANFIVSYNGHLYLNTVDGNTARPIYDKKKNGDDKPDFDNVTGCGWINCTNTVKVKEKIIELSKYMGSSETGIAYFEEKYEAGNISLETLKEEIEKRFAMNWLIDYYLLINLIRDGDSVRKNWQWTTWGEIDGQTRWYANPYDMDSAFGVNSTHSFPFSSPLTSQLLFIDREVPTIYVMKYYKAELKERYNQLREAGIISYDAIFNLFKNYVQAVGLDNYENELAMWPEMPCYRAPEINSCWKYTGKNGYLGTTDIPTTWNSSVRYGLDEFTRYNYRCFKSRVADNIGHTPVEYETTEYWEDVTYRDDIMYSAGSITYDGLTAFYQFKALEDTSNRPFNTIYDSYPHEGGVFDSIYRISKWIDTQIHKLNTIIDTIQP